MSRKKKRLASPPATRNRVALNPLMTKGQVHEKTGKAKRRQQRVALKKTWFERAAAIAASGSNQVFVQAFMACFPVLLRTRQGRL